MVVKKADMKVEKRSAWRGGDGAIECRHLAPQGNPAKWRFAAELTFAPGDSIGEHAHSGETELYYVMEGEGTVMDNGQPVQVGPGDAVFTGGGASHSIKNTGDGILRLLALVVEE
ncbi:cupin domain-containing protein [Zongyangia hominis]|uniref:Cupin domain-containing protein n=1 Tax=Zongyangia hominis TaxID=2763677 RepID=A0A926EBS3_9FIRM|nr:cupin domain-containing protein [Zongyangia hominis]MBC8570158.1 cupin domain-containing protein [Zongyangia hominis]